MRVRGSTQVSLSDAVANSYGEAAIILESDDDGDDVILLMMWGIAMMQEESSSGHPKGGGEGGVPASPANKRYLRAEYTSDAGVIGDQFTLGDACEEPQQGDQDKVAPTRRPGQGSPDKDAHLI
jgi:hypothetical protein